MFSRVQFRMDMKTTSLLMILALCCAGFGLMIRAYLEGPDEAEETATES